MLPSRHPWLDRLVADPGRALDTLLRGVAYLPGLQRASPSEALLALLGDLPPEAPEWSLLDGALLSWLKARRASPDGPLGRPGGTERFIRETGEAIRAAWRLALPQSSDWIRAELLDLLRWADGFSLDATFDLGRAVLIAATHLQRGSELRFLWLRTCEEAAAARLRHRLSAALLGLAKVPDAPAGGPSHDLIVGLARWAVRLPDSHHAKGEVIREWRALKAAFPRQPGFWRREWQAILDDPRIDAHPFTDWLKEADAALRAPIGAGRPRRVPPLPKDIRGTIKQMERKYREGGLTVQLWRDMDALLSQVERYADATGESYYLVTSCTNIARIVMDQAPGHALALTRRALLWTPSNGHAWSVRATALDRLGRPDLAEAVLWEAVRRVPSNAVIANDLALSRVARGGLAEAEALLRKAATLDPSDAPTFVELARVLWLRGRADEAQTLLRDFLSRTDDVVMLYTLCSLLVAEGRTPKAAETLRFYRHRFGSDQHAATLDRLIAAGPEGREEIRAHLRQPRQRGGAVQAVPWDAESAERALAAEQTELPRLQRIGQVAEADLLFRIGPEHRAEALRLVDAALADPADAYAQVVKGLAVPEHRIEMIGRASRFAGSLPVRLALTPEDAGDRHWRELIERFPEGRHLTRLVQLSCGQADAAAIPALAVWCKEPTRWDNGWDAYLKDTVARLLEGESTPVGLDTLTHDALTQAVDVGMNATPLAA
jgi:tetratricopeptide (TPR) repeat protein